MDEGTTGEVTGKRDEVLAGRGPAAPSGIVSSCVGILYFSVTAFGSISNERTVCFLGALVFNSLMIDILIKRRKTKRNSFLRKMNFGTSHCEKNKQMELTKPKPLTQQQKDRILRNAERDAIAMLTFV